MRNWSEESAHDVDSIADTASSLPANLGDLAVAASEPASSVLVVIEVNHPTLPGRVRCRGESGRIRWLPTLRGMSIHVGDRVLVTRPGEFAESIVIGVLDGFVPRDRPIADAGPRLSLLAEEALRIETPNGTPVCEVRCSDEGPVVRLLTSDLTIETEGRLKLSARTIELEARQGPVKVEATDDVVIMGETIHLN